MVKYFSLEPKPVKKTQEPFKKRIGSATLCNIIKKICSNQCCGYKYITVYGKGSGLRYFPQFGLDAYGILSAKTKLPNTFF